VTSTRFVVFCSTAALTLCSGCTSRPAAVATPALAAGHAAPATAAAAPAAPAATPATSIETVWKTRDALAGKTVTVRGKVMKFNGGILGVNWIHLQDGTGSAVERTNDITVTSDDEVKVGDEVTMTGTVTVNKDLGSGYNYPVIIEQARVVH
jgi:uncharacterized protein YdeI (BOF family)